MLNLFQIFVPLLRFREKLFFAGVSVPKMNPFFGTHHPPQKYTPSQNHDPFLVRFTYLLLLTSSAARWVAQGGMVAT